MTVWCAVDICETEAVKMVCHPDGNATPLCWRCATTYEWGQASPEAEIQNLEHVEYKKGEDGTYSWLVD
jgi:hypothetical protein